MSDAGSEGGEEIHSRVYSRVGLLGNPSDAYGGRCISFSLANFWAEVRIIIPVAAVQRRPLCTRTRDIRCADGLRAASLMRCMPHRCTAPRLCTLPPLCTRHRWCSHPPKA